MRPSPMYLTTEEINNLVERGMLPPKAETIPEHPLATKLYRDFKPGSKIMTKDEAYRIGNELDALWARVKELEAAGASLVRQVMGAKESLSRPPTRSVAIYPGSGEEPRDFKHVNWPYEDEE